MRTRQIVGTNVSSLDRSAILWPLPPSHPLWMGSGELPYAVPGGHPLSAPFALRGLILDFEHLADPGIGFYPETCKGSLTKNVVLFSPA